MSSSNMEDNCPIKRLNPGVKQLSSSDGTLTVRELNGSQLHRQLSEVSGDEFINFSANAPDQNGTNPKPKTRKRYGLHRSNTAVEPLCSSCLGYMSATARYPPSICDRRTRLLGLNNWPTDGGHLRNSRLFNQDGYFGRISSSHHQVNEKMPEMCGQEKRRSVHFPTSSSIAGNETNLKLKSISSASTFPIGSPIISSVEHAGFKSNSSYDSQFLFPNSQCCQHCHLNLEHAAKTNWRWKSQSAMFPNEDHSISAEKTSVGLTWRRLHMSRAKLKATATTSELLSGFAMVAMVELQINEPTNVPEWLFIMFSVCTTVLVAVHIFALMISTYLLPNIEAISKMQSDKLVEESPHERMKGFVEVAWAFSTVLGLFLFLVEVAILCWVKFWDFSIKAAMAATIIVIPVLIVFIIFVFHFYRSLMFYKCESSTTDINELEKIRKKLDSVSPV